MKAKLKSVRKGSSTTTTSQVEIQLDAVTVVFISPRSYKKLASVDFPRKLFMRIQAAATQRNQTLPEFFIAAIELACKKAGLFAALERRAA